MNLNLKEFLTKNKETFQLVYGVFLIVLIPLLIWFNTNTIIERYKENLDVSLQRQALVVGRSIYALLKDDLDSQEKIQKKIESLSSRNLEFQSIEILVPEKDKENKKEYFKIIASLKKENIGKNLDLDYYQLAWDQKDNDGLATDSFRAITTKEGEELMGDLSRHERFWILAMPMRDSSGEKRAVLSIKSSSKIIDDLANNNRDISTYWLAITVFAVILFLSINIRLWDYVLLYKKIKEVDQMKDEFISMASHELRTPLGAIKGYTSLILEETFGKIENEEMQKSLKKVMALTNRLNELVDDLLNVSRIEQGRLSVENENIEIEPIVEEIISQLKVSADEKGLSLEYLKPKEKLPKIFADPERLKQILVNLIGNSIKYTFKGSVKVYTELKNGKLEIRVADTGIGISAEEQKHLFEKFQRVKNEETANISGTGLGLWITKQIVELMKGKIYLESMKGAGSQFTVVLGLGKEK